MLAIVDYGVGNLFSLCSSLKSLNQPAVITSDPKEISAADRVILPGVGAFGDAAEKLRNTGLDTVVREQAEAEFDPLELVYPDEIPLFEKSYEFGEHAGLGLLRGNIVPMKGTIPEGLKIPQMGWNSLTLRRSHPLLRDIKDGDCVYFVHSYYADGCDDSLIAFCDYGREITAAVASGNVMGCQFHPEKSGKVGLSILKAFCEVPV